MSGLRVPYRGGNADNGGNAGLEYLNVNNGVSTSNANYGSPLNFTVRSVCQLSVRSPERNRTPWWKIHIEEVPVNMQLAWLKAGIVKKQTKPMTPL